MSCWDSTTQTIIRFPPKQSEHYPAWDEIDCGCCAGIKWGGDSPVECDDCGGNGVQYLHRKSKVIALYPGGLFRGKQ